MSKLGTAVGIVAGIVTLGGGIVTGYMMKPNIVVTKIVTKEKIVKAPVKTVVKTVVQRVPTKVTILKTALNYGTTFKPTGKGCKVFNYINRWDVVCK